MNALGTALCGASAAYLAWRFARGPRPGAPGLYGLAGPLVMLAAAALAALGVRPVSTFFTPIVWTGYILTLDAAVLRARGRSLLSSERGAFGWMALVSIGLWLVFEAYNLRLANWKYIGLPENTVVRSLGYLWSFATIWPAILETTEFLLATRTRNGAPRPITLPSTLMVGVGAAFVIVPVLAPVKVGAYLFGFVWMGFALLLEPLNYRARRASLMGDLRAGNRDRLGALMVAGVVCGFFWEFWNHWAGARWVYIFPIFQRAKIFEMPLPGYLGFPAFAVEVFAMYVYVTGVLRVPYHEVQ